ncbi:MAG: DUF3592 domain-containing protein [Streptosporangiales bacterium]|nr:DUF3592 domain-containing protein [Streptosporangiales bacterium]MBO0890968.1 DUF3592 domain-containing protein [Acidothermales bacterium]
MVSAPEEKRAAVGLSFVVRGARRGKDWLVLRRGATTTATVTDIRRVWHSNNSDSDSGGAGHHVYYPVLGFAAEDGKQVQTIAENGTSSERYQVGDVIDVRYDRADPTHAYAESVLYGGATSFVSTLAGLGAVILGVYLFFRPW